MPHQIVTLAKAILADAEALSDYLTEHSLEEPSFEALDTAWQLSPELEARRQGILNMTTELWERISQPRELVHSKNEASHALTTLTAIAKFDLAKHLEPDEEASYEQISGRSGLAVPDTKRFLRLAMCYRLFREVRPGVVAHTAASVLFARDPAMIDWIGAASEELWPSAMQAIPAMLKWPGSQEPEHCGFSLAHGTERSFYNELEHHPERARQFASNMSRMMASPGFNFRHVVDGYDWAALGGATVVDLGGSHGDMMITLARHFPKLQCVVQDLAEVINSRPPLPADLEARVQFQAHDFFTPQPVKHAQVYFLRWIFHGWSDKYCVQILRNLIPALQPGARIIINDICLPDPGAHLPPPIERRTRTMDLVQLILRNSREHSQQDFYSLFAAADRRFHFEEVIRPPGSVLALTTARWEPSS